MSRKINWSDAPFGWPAEPALDEKALNSPQPCSHGSGCRYDGPCAFVHKGEEGTGRRLFPARTVDGKEQAACVRLIGSPGFYERRRLRLSWPEWCAKKGIQHGASGASTSKPAQPPISAAPGEAAWPALAQRHSFAAAPAQTPQLNRQMLQPFPTGYGMPYFTDPTYLQQVIAQHGNIERALEFNRQQQQLMLWQQSLAGQAQQAAAAAAKKAKDEERNQYGEKLFAKLTPFVADLQVSMADKWPKGVTAGKLTGMFLELDKEEWEEMLVSDDAMYAKVGEALEVLNEASS
jgi:hypothetical protein